MWKADRWVSRYGCVGLMALWVLVPTVGWAAEEPPPQARAEDKGEPANPPEEPRFLPGSGEKPRLRLVEAEAAFAKSEEFKAWRVLTETGIGMVGMTAVTLFTPTLLNAVCERFSSCVVPITAWSLLSTVALSSAMWLGGNAWHGRGDLAYTMLGIFIGSGVAVLMSPLLAGAPALLTVGLVQLVTIAGAVVGYEWSSAMKLNEARESQARLAPVVGLTQGGGLVGLAGRF